MLTLYYGPGSCALASHIALEEAGATYQAVRLDLRQGDQRKPDYLAINPKGRVPALRTERGILTESPVILGYIAQAHPGAGLADIGDSFAFAEMQAFNLFLASTVHIAFAHIFRPERFADGATAADAMRAKAIESLAAAFGLIEERFADGRPFVQGDRYTVADPYLYVFERWYRRDGVGNPEAYPRVKEHHERVAGRPAVQRVLQAEGLQ